MISLEALTCGYTSRVVLETIAATFEAGTVSVLLGPNGSGKSTLLKTISGSIPALSGTVRVGGETLGELRPDALARKLAFVPQEEAIHFSFSARQVAMMGRMPHSTRFWDSNEDHSIVEASMAAADCLRFADRSVMELSGGEKQRVLIARALAQQTDVLLLDEPTAHLDVAHQSLLARLLKKMASEGKTIIAAVHDLNFAANLGSHAVLLNERRIVAEGDLDAVVDSKSLEQVYGIEFTRVRLESGQAALIPNLGN